ncbi:uncharacterized protein PGRI_002260 [Penicillium griseofulvum]|uniref:Uncharacterized protein n=1 Tax=Penicillium patulum TaxID=5078 RepID=A0A135LW40_PENPA|nr:uncharacterized protein PGRI_002260 [Penicillium griseofulvum]KXG53176.1 hypothetical protein PGRI_002260 [Penicillium griseofulvum]
MAHDQIREISHKLKPLYRGKSTSFEKFQAKIRWHFVKDDFQVPIATLGSVKSSLNLLTSLAMLDSAIANFSRVPNWDPVRKSQALDKITALKKQTRRTERQFIDSIGALHGKTSLNGHPDTAGNIRVITVIIEDIRKDTIKDARDLIKRFSKQSPVEPPADPDISSQLTSADDMSSSNPAFVVITRNSSGPKPRKLSLRDRSFTRDSIHTLTKEPTPVPSELGLRGETRGQRPVSPHYSDRVTVDPELELSVAHAIDNTDTDIPHQPRIYQPMPPFDESDLREREIRNGRRQSCSRCQRGG